MADSNLTVGDGDKVYIGPNGSYITESSSNLTFYDPTVAATKTLTQLAAAGASTLDSAFDGGKVIDGANSSGNALKVGYTSASNYNLSLYHDGTDMYMAANIGDLKITAQGGDVNFADENITTTGAVNASGGINIGADNINLTLGASGATDSKIYFDGTNLTLYDAVAGAVTLSTLAGSNLTNPTVVGDMTISDGKVTQTDTDDEIAYQVTSSGTTVDVVKIIASPLTSGSAIAVHTVDATMTNGYYYRAYNGAATVFGVKRYGEIEITGSAAADMITVTAGNFQLDNGKFEVDTTQDITSYVKRNNATGTNAVFEVEQTHATGGKAITVDQNATGDVDAVSIENAGTGFAVTTTAAAAGGEGYEYIAAASGTGMALNADGTTGSWIGAANTGLITATSDGALATTDASLVWSYYTGNAGGANQLGSCAYFEEAGAASGESYAVGINSTNNNGLNIITGAVGCKNLVLSGIQGQTDNMVYVDGSTGTGWVGAADTAMLQLKTDGTLANAAASMQIIDFDGTYANNGLGGCLYIDDDGTAAGTNYSVYVNSNAVNGILVRNVAVGTTGIVIDGPASQTAAMLKVDGSVGSWIGADGVGMVHLASDGTNAHANASLLNIIKTGATVAAMDGSCLRIDDASTGGATGGYAVSINASGALEALHVDAGTVVVDETLQAAGGLITQVDVTDVSNPPTDAELDGAIGTPTAGRMVYINDANGGANEYLVIGDGTKWWQLTMTACA